MKLKPIRDAKKNFIVTPTQKNVNDAVPGDEYKCVWANAGRDKKGVLFVSIRKTRAIVTYQDGTRERLVVPALFVSILDEYDNGKGWLLPLDKPYAFLAPTGKQTLKHVRERTKQQKKDRWKNPETGERYADTGRQKKRVYSGRGQFTSEVNRELKRQRQEEKKQTRIERDRRAIRAVMESTRQRAEHDPHDPHDPKMRKCPCECQRYFTPRKRTQIYFDEKCKNKAAQKRLRDRLAFAA